MSKQSFDACIGGKKRAETDAKATEAYQIEMRASFSQIISEWREAYEDDDMK